MRKHIFVFYLLLITQLFHAQNVIDLAGEWSFQIDKENAKELTKMVPCPLTTKSTCPVLCRKKLARRAPFIANQWTGSLYDSSFYITQTGNVPTYRKYKVSFFPLLPERRYVGAAWYKREIHIPSSWKGKRDAVSGTSTYWNNSLDKQPAYRFTKQPAWVPLMNMTSCSRSSRTSTLTLRIDNHDSCAKVGQNSHSITDHTQGNWNGVVGRMYLYVLPEISFKDIQVFPEPDKQQAPCTYGHTGHKIL